jgi:hypothetical protein
VSYLLVENFVFGMDRRRKRVAGTPGTLWLGKNVHITRGGDIERRKKFVPEYDVAGTFGLASIRSQPYVFGSADLASSMPNGVQYQRLQAPSTPAMSRVLAAKSFAGKFYVIAEYVDGNIYHFYDGTRVTDWDVIAASGASFESVASAMADRLGATGLVTAQSFGASALFTAVEAGTGFTLAKSTTDGGGTNDQDITLTTVQANVVAVEEVLSSFTIAVTGGTDDPTDNDIRSVIVNDVEILDSVVPWSGSNETTAINLAAQINFGFAAHGYSATVEGAVVTVLAAPGTGTTPNGYTVTVIPHGDVVVENDDTMAGGVAAVAAQKQVVKAAFSGTFEVEDTFVLTLNGTDYKLTGAASGTGRSLYVDKHRVWSPVGSLWRYSMLDRADIFDPANAEAGNDAGFINIASESEGNENLIVANRYQGLAAIFSPNNIVLFQLDPDPNNFAFSDILENTGTRSPDSVIRYGNNDVFYQDITGIRSLRARDSSNAPFVSDVGNAIDTFVAEQLALLTGEQVAHTVAAIEPLDGRYLLFAGGIAFVLSYFPGAKISAWTYYDNEEFEGNAVQAVVRLGSKLAVRAGDGVFIYGGFDGDVYPDDEEILGEVQLPFLSGKTPATIKDLKGFDSAATNTWEVEVAFDPNDEDKTINVGRLDSITFADPNKVAMPGRTTMLAPKLICRTAGEASISMLAIHYDTEDENVG